MGIKMRTVKGDQESICKVCGATRKQSLEMFEIAFTDRAKITLCDLCNNKLLQKTLKASCKIDNRIKTKEDMVVIKNRKASGKGEWYQEE